MADGATDYTSSYEITFVSVPQADPELAGGTINGTVIYAPAAIDIGEGFPGQTVTSGAYTVERYSTEAGMTVTVTLSTALTDGTNTIAKGDLSLLTTDGITDTVVGPLSSPQPLKKITAMSPDGQLFRLRVQVPSSPAGTYAGSLTFSLTAP